MTEHTTGTSEEWLAARLEVLEAEKELTGRSDELARQRQQLPWVQLERTTVSRPPRGADIGHQCRMMRDRARLKNCG